jgi:hypothetical protein
VGSTSRSKDARTKRATSSCSIVVDDGARRRAVFKRARARSSALFTPSTVAHRQVCVATRSSR